MLFHSLPFLIVFLPAVLAVYYALASKAVARRWCLIAASLMFYGYWDARFVPLLAGSVAANWVLARLLAKGAAAMVLPLGIALNLGLLGLFKYADFFAGEIAALVGQAPAPWSLVLPLGISFFTFQQISYLVDLKRGRTRPYGLADYAAYVTFFPHLIAGPIVRHDELISQFDLAPARPGLAERLSRGLVLFAIGMVKKVFIADTVSRIADPLFAAAAQGQAPGFAEAWLAALAFTVQIYFDFSGYSDMAIGLALLFGLSFPINFAAPYGASSIREFWRRWHITLSRFLRDYLYVPLGGNRRGRSRQAAAALATMLLGGLWHGAGWTFVAWGGIHGLALVINQAWARRGVALPASLGWLLTSLVVIPGWVLFRASDFGSAWALLAAMAGTRGFDLGFARTGLGDLWLVPVGLALAALGPTSQQVAGERLVPNPWFAATAGTALVLAMLKVGGGRNVDFIYFQF